MVSALRVVLLPHHPVDFELIRSYTPGELLDSSIPDAPLVKVQMLVDIVFRHAMQCLNPVHIALSLKGSKYG